MNLEEDYSDALQKMDNQFKRNKVLSFLNLIKDDLGALNGAMLDQVQPTLLKEDMQDILGKVAVYATLASTTIRCGCKSGSGGFYQCAKARIC